VTLLEEPRGNKAEPLSSAPSPPEGGSLRPEDVMFEEMDEGIGGIIIPGARKPKDKAKPK
jgi:hypothetical protein